MFVNLLKQKKLLWFLLITFTFSWILFLLPLLFGQAGTPTRQTATLIAWSLAMWAPGLAAIFVTLLVERKPIGALNLQNLGDRRMYLWAWGLPIVLTIIAGVLTWLLGVGRLDLEFSQIGAAMAQAGGSQLPAWVAVAIQIASALTIGPLFNTLFAMGEELGWRGYLLPGLLPHGQMRAILLSGLIWGFWHAPVILQGHNYPSQPALGVFMMIVFCVLFGAILSWIYLRTHSPWAPALGHGSLNAIAGVSILFMPGTDLVIGGPPSSLIGWIPLIAFVGWLVWSKRLPVSQVSRETIAQ